MNLSTDGVCKEVMSMKLEKVYDIDAFGEAEGQILNSDKDGNSDWLICCNCNMWTSKKTLHEKLSKSTYVCIKCSNFHLLEKEHNQLIATCNKWKEDCWNLKKKLKKFKDLTRDLFDESTIVDAITELNERCDVSSKRVEVLHPSTLSVPEEVLKIITSERKECNPTSKFDGKSDIEVKGNNLDGHKNCETYEAEESGEICQSIEYDEFCNQIYESGPPHSRNIENFDSLDIKVEIKSELPFEDKGTECGLSSFGNFDSEHNFVTKTEDSIFGVPFSSAIDGEDYSGSNLESSELELNKQETTDFHCKHCNYTSITNDQLKDHISTVHANLKPFHCKDCDYKARYKKDLKKHVNAIHLKYYPFACSLCPYTAITGPILKQHVNGFHFNKRPHKCSLCDYSANQKASLRSHTDKVHLNLLAFSCSFCEYKTHKKHFLKRHINIHLGLKEFKCPHCDFESNHERSVQGHVKNIHSNLKKFET